MLARMFSGNPFLKDIYSTHSWFNHCAPVVDSMMPQDAILQELYQLLCSVNNYNWELGGGETWNNIKGKKAVF